MNKIIFQTKGQVGTIILNNPKKLNCFDLQTIKELNNSLDKIKKSKLKAIVLRGKGNSFCSGGDIEWERYLGQATPAKAKKILKFVQNVFSKIESLPQVFIAIMQGHTVGGGNELAMACDIRIALPSSFFTHPETRLGTVPPLGGTQRLPRLIGLGRAKYMLFTGSSINSSTALRWNLVDFIVREEDLGGFLRSTLDRIVTSPAKALALTKKSINKNYSKDLKDEFELNSYLKCSKTKENKKILQRFLKG
jgi:enoyl-CoA hydratase/carnithine racemase